MLFLKGAAGALVVFDVTKQESFDNAKKWIDLINNSCDTKIVISLLGNKCDKVGRVVPYNVIKEFAFNNSMNYFEVSAKTGKNIIPAFHTLAAQIYDLTHADSDATSEHNSNNNNNITTYSVKSGASRRNQSTQQTIVNATSRSASAS